MSGQRVKYRQRINRLVNLLKNIKAELQQKPGLSPTTAEWLEEEIKSWKQMQKK